jgi:diguanylate cyclase (GGDEF)-like protein
MPSPSEKVHEMQQSPRRIDRKDSAYWWNAVLAVTLLMGAIVLLSVAKPSNRDSLELAIAVRGLLGLVLIFGLYTLYHQHLLRQFRHTLADQAEIAAKQQTRAETLYALAILDPLTGLYNRRFGEEHLRIEIERAGRSNKPLIALLFDLDNFKEINDRHGHAAGDQALKEFAHLLQKATRGSDFAVRMGGDEFLVVLTECPPEKVQLVLSRLAQFHLLETEAISVSASFGWAQLQLGETSKELLERADKMLYANKANRFASV